MTAPEVFVTRLNETVEKMGVFNATLARATGVSVCTIHGWRKGKNMPDGYNLIGLCRALDVSADWLLGLDREECE